VSFNAGNSNSTTAGGGNSDGRTLLTGGITLSGGGWAGIMTSPNNTGLASNNLGATAVSANANVTFGGGNGGSQ
jgi:hypothetical protein